MRIAWKLMACVATLLLAGCGGSLEATVDGIVTLDGKPLGTGTVTFHPVNSGAPAYGMIQPDGRYTLTTGVRQGLVPGPYRVTVVATARSTGHGAESTEAIGTLLTPRRYGQPEQSGLRFTIMRGVNHFDLALQSR